MYLYIYIHPPYTDRYICMYSACIYIYIYYTYVYMYMPGPSRQVWGSPCHSPSSLKGPAGKSKGDAHKEANEAM